MLKELFIFFSYCFTSRTPNILKIIHNKRLMILWYFKNTNLPVDIIILDDPGLGSLYSTPRPLVSIFTEVVDVEHITGIDFSY